MDEDLKLTERLRQKAIDLRLGDYYRSGGVGKSAVVADEKARIFEEAAEAITRLRAEIEALKSDVSDLVRAGSDEATEVERLVKERDELRADNAKLRRMMEAREKLGEAFGVDMHKNATEIALEFAQREINATTRAETAEAQRDAALEALKASREGLSIAAGWARSKPDSQRARDKIKRGLDAIREVLNPAKAARAASRTLEGVEP